MERKELLKRYRKLLNTVNWLEGVITKYGYADNDNNIASSLRILSYDLDSTLSQEIKYCVLARDEHGGWSPLYLSDHLITFNSNKIKGYSFSGVIRNNSLDNVFEIISLTAPITYVSVGDTIYLNEK